MAMQKENDGNNDLIYPLRTGDGSPDCPDCHGRGCVQHILPNGLPGVVRCHCVLYRDILANVERGWAKLSGAAKVKDTPLWDKTQECVYVTAANPDFKAHLRTAAIKRSYQQKNWYFRVVTDADLMTAWLSNLAEKGEEIYDADVVRDIEWERGYRDLVALVHPPDLLIIRVGIKTARNAAMPEVLAEALLQREHEGRPTWVVDSPRNPLKEGCLSWSETVMDILDDWPHIVLKPDLKEKSSGTPARPSPGLEQTPKAKDMEPNKVFDPNETPKEDPKKWKTGSKPYKRGK